MHHLFFAAAQACGNGTGGLVDASGLPHTCATSDTIRTIFLWAFAIIGGVAFLFMVIGGMRYTLSKGEPDNVQRAKNELKYSAIGLIIAGSAAAIVNFVINRLGS